MIVSFVRGDVNGDNVSDNIYLTGERNPNSPFVENITLVIQDGRTGRMYYSPFEFESGYDPTISLYDFTGDGIQDILIGINSGGSGAIIYYYIFSALNNIPKLIFDYNNFNDTYKYKVIYKDFYKVEIVNIKDNIKYIIDIAYKGREYLNEIYDKNGKLKEPIEGFVDPLSGLYPIDFDSDGVYELLAYQKISGRYHADGLGFILSSLEFNGKKFNMFDQYVAINGTKK
ncbi:MAG: VCBS repeat-containing protein [Senegalia sp. (in: firmicutes)]|uniref:VCBS repeat-containing protein n=1 Tax=Senegalia sp. (in: firmicutes) TaxID=1924098 RepID=UPI003F9B1C24